MRRAVWMLTLMLTLMLMLTQVAMRMRTL